MEVIADMTIQDGINMILYMQAALNDRYTKFFGQIVLRLDDSSYLMSDENLLLSSLHKKNIKQYDINTGNAGKILRARKDIGAFVFACTEYSVSFSEKNSLLLPSLDDLAEIIGPEVKVAKTLNTRDLLRACRMNNGCLVKGKGIFTIGRNLHEAIAGMRIIEKSVEAECFAEKVKGVKYISKENAKKLRAFYNDEYASVNSSGNADFIDIDSREFDLRNKLIDVGKKLCKKMLVQGTWGNLSLRLNSNEMLVTPSGMDYFKIKTEDIVKVDIDTLHFRRFQRKPSTEMPLHAAIYRKSPDCRAVIHTHSNGCSIFAAAQTGFKIGDTNLKKIIGDVNISKYALPGTKDMHDNVLEALADGHACIISNHGAIFTAGDLDTALQIADAVESKACNLLGFNRQ